MNLVKYLFLLLIIGFHSKISCQEANFSDENFIQVSSGLNFGYFKDSKLSSNIYKFAMPGFILGFKKSNKERIHKTNVLFSSGKTKKDSYFNMFDATPFSELLQVNMDFSYMWNVYDIFGDNGSIYIGPDLGLNITSNTVTNFGNNKSNLFIMGDIGLKSQINRSFRLLNIDWNANLELGVPLFGLVNRESVLSDFDNNTIGKYLRLNTDISLEMKIREVNKLALGYSWQYFNNTGKIDRLQISNGYIYIKLFYAI